MLRLCSMNSSGSLPPRRNPLILDQAIAILDCSGVICDDIVLDTLALKLSSTYLPSHIYKVTQSGVLTGLHAAKIHDLMQQHTMSMALSQHVQQSNSPMPGAAFAILFLVSSHSLPTNT